MEICFVSFVKSRTKLFQTFELSKQFWDKRKRKNSQDTFFFCQARAKNYRQKQYARMVPGADELSIWGWTPSVRKPLNFAGWSTCILAQFLSLDLQNTHQLVSDISSVALFLNFGSRTGATCTENAEHRLVLSRVALSESSPKEDCKLHGVLKAMEEVSPGHWGHRRGR